MRERLLDLFVPGIPALQGSKTGYVRGSRAISVESPKKVKPWRENVSRVARTQCAELLERTIEVTLECVMPRTQAHDLKAAPPMVQKPELDKLIRSTWISLSGIAYKDDSFVTHIHATKRRAELEEPTGATSRPRA